MRLARLLRAALAAIVASSLTGCGPVFAALHRPDALPSLVEDSRVHYEPGGREYALAVAKILPRAVAKIEAVQGRPFDKPFVVVAFMDEDAYATANGAGSARPTGVAFFDRVALSPRVWREEPRELEAYLTHELSHAHLHIHLSLLGYALIPAWFQEGLAVMASDGGGAQRVSIEEARRAILGGQVIETPDEERTLFAGLKPPKRFDGDIYRQMHMAYRQAGMFVERLHEKDPAAFKELLDRIFSGQRFGPAFEESYGSSVAEQWSRFTQNLSSN